MDSALHAIFSTGLVASSVLIALLALSRLVAKWSIWPCPDHRSWQAVTFWLLFRLANVATLLTLVISHAPGLFSSAPRIGALALGLVVFGAYIAACFELGHRNLYGGTDGLRTRGLYRWSRNPQYATAIPGYLLLALAAWSPQALALAALVSIVFWLMAVLEEAWLERAYPQAYARYSARVPRFFNVRRLRAALRRGLMRRRVPPLAPREMHR